MLVAIFVICGLVAGTVCVIEVGYRVGRRCIAARPEWAENLSATVQGSVFGLMGLLVAFTFYGAASRFDNRRNLMVEEANVIGTAYLRLDLLPAELQPGIRADFRKYVHSRIATFEKIPDVQATQSELERSIVIQTELWKEVVESIKTSGPTTQSLVLSSMNQLIDITTKQTVALTTHPPVAIYVMLALASLISSALAGYTISFSGRRDWMQILTFSLLLGVAIYVILDYEYPRIGFIRIDPVDQLLVEVMKKMK